MCGVIGYVGRRAASERLMAALEQLEHRGYDSAGICLMGDGRLHSVRSVGRLAALRGKVNGSAPGHTAGIGHTRWATHGKVTERNAHPLPAGNHSDVAVVLNGIIENHTLLRAELEAEGEEFSSDTDAEVVSHLVRRHYEGSLEEAVRRATERLEGHFAFLAVHREHERQIVGTRRACPLLAGGGNGSGEAFLASSPLAFLGETRRVTALEDGDVAIIEEGRLRVSSLDGTPRRREATMVAEAEKSPELGDYETFMRKEIDEQPDAVAATVLRLSEPDVNGLDAFASLGLPRRIDRVLVVACGSALHAGRAALPALRSWARLPAETAVASEWRYEEPHLEPGTLVIGVTQSGETADTLAALRLARRLGAHTIVVTNSPGSQVTREVDGVLPTHAGVEVGVAATKTYVTQVVALSMLALHLAEREAHIDAPSAELLRSRMRALPDQMRAALGCEAQIEALMPGHEDAPLHLLLGRQSGHVTCQEAALKITELCGTPAEAYAAGEMKHGPIALISEGTQVIGVATDARMLDKMLSNLEEVRARGAEVTVIARDGDSRPGEVADHVLGVPRTDPILQPILDILPLQLLSHRLARVRGLDVDRPRNLAKTVTVE